MIIMEHVLVLVKTTSESRPTIIYIAMEISDDYNWSLPEKIKFNPEWTKILIKDPGSSQSWYKCEYDFHHHIHRAILYSSHTNVKHSKTIEFNFLMKHNKCWPWKLCLLNEKVIAVRTESELISASFFLFF